MHGDAVRARRRERLDKSVHRRNHQMHIERFLGVRPDRFDDLRPDGDVGHEMAVHDVDMNEVGARRFDRLDLGPQAREIGR